MADGAQSPFLRTTDRNSARSNAASTIESFQVQMTNHHLYTKVTPSTICAVEMATMREAGQSANLQS